MTLGELLDSMEVAESHCDPAAEVLGLAYDSRRVQAGELFFALAGRERDGAAFAAEALDAGAVAVMAARAPGRIGAPWARVDDPRKALAQAAAAFHGHPSRALTVVGVTGTNGKTTTTYLLEGVFRAAGRVSGVIGTTGYRLGDESRVAPFTTPEAPELQGLLAEMRTRGVAAVAIEISSHGLTQRRAFGLECDAAIFTNLSRDHLDYHGSMESYLDAKLMLFDGRNDDRPSKVPVSVINADDPAAERVAQVARAAGRTVRTFGAAANADCHIEDLETHPDGMRFTLVEAGRQTPIALALLGRHNVSNAAAAFCAARAIGIEPQVAARGLEAVRGVPGRLERVAGEAPFEVVVDYAHTPDSLALALATAREHARGRVLLVFGCGGNRDAGKRPLMGRIAAAGSDAAWVTNDNPRSEDPEAIAAAIVRGAASGQLRVELDRRQAIAAALDAARAGDIVLIAGKGHEATQTIGDSVLPFDDRAVARALLGARTGEGR